MRVEFVDDGDALRLVVRRRVIPSTAVAGFGIIEPPSKGTPAPAHSRARRFGKHRRFVCEPDGHFGIGMDLAWLLRTAALWRICGVRALAENVASAASAVEDWQRVSDAIQAQRKGLDLQTLCTSPAIATARRC